MIVIEALDHINIAAKDLEKSIEFYTVFLDFECVESNENEATITFDEQLKIKLVKSETASTNPEYPALSFILDIDDFTEGLQVLETNEIAILSGPIETENGENVIISDPAGNAIELYYVE
ncbi:MAG: VOC family protein [Leptospirales bacterium]